MHSYPLDDDRAPAFEPATKIEQIRIEALHDNLVRSLTSGDVSTLNRLLGRAFVLRLPCGSVMRKLELLDRMNAGDLQYRSFFQEARSVRFSGLNMAFITGSCTMELLNQGKWTRGRFRYTTLCVQNGGPWQAVAMFQYDGVHLAQ